MPFVQDQETPAGFWDSVAEGASWPRAQHSEAQAVEPAVAEVAPAAVDPVDTWSWTGSEAVKEAEPPEAVEVSDAPVLESPQPAEPVADATPQWSEDVQAWMLEAAVDAPLSEQGTSDTPEASHEKRQPLVPSVGAEMPPTLSAGWPDESAWSQSFEWQALKPELPGSTAASQPEEPRIDVSDIVAQVKAELEAARAQGIEIPEDSEEYAPSFGDAGSMPEPELDDEARREEVSRAVVEMRAQLEAGDFEGALRDNGFETGPEQSFGASFGSASSTEQSEEDMRAEVRRAVEATRDELAGTQATVDRSEKPAFRLAAPGSIPDWSHMQMEPSGPPVVVMKDVDGRVELASVYETLNELGCGDGAALLNYTPHSVTVGLPISAKVPSKEQVSEAVEKVFGLTSRVESDGVRITVSIGVDPKRRSVDAA